MIYIEFISRRPGVSIEDFHADAGAGQEGWADGYGEDRLVLNVGRTWRMGPEPEYLAVWHTPARGLDRVDDWEEIFTSGAADRFEEPFKAVARIDRAGCYRELLEPEPARSGPYYAELFELADGATADDAADYLRARGERHSSLTLPLACLRMGRLGPDPAGLAVWRGASYASFAEIAEDLPGADAPLVVRDAAFYHDFGRETL
jgi:hypothetical protein